MTTTTGDCLLAAIAAHPEDDLPKLVYADWLQEEGDEILPYVIRQQVYHRLPFAVTPVRDVDLPHLSTVYDWKEVFGQGSGGNCSQKADACPPDSGVDCTPPNIEDVVEVLAASNGEGDGAEWVGLFRMGDGADRRRLRLVRLLRLGLTGE
jgi:uncharacterized protein (TIGR02996 family)